jgi:hypothetical protein
MAMQQRADLASAIGSYCSLDFLRKRRGCRLSGTGDVIRL